MLPAADACCRRRRRRHRGGVGCHGLIVWRCTSEPCGHIPLPEQQRATILHCCTMLVVCAAAARRRRPGAGQPLLKGRRAALNASQQHAVPAIGDISVEDVRETQCQVASRGALRVRLALGPEAACKRMCVFLETHAKPQTTDIEAADTALARIRAAPNRTAPASRPWSRRSQTRSWVPPAWPRATGEGAAPPAAAAGAPQQRERRQPGAKQWCAQQQAICPTLALVRHALLPRYSHCTSACAPHPPCRSGGLNRYLVVVALLAAQAGGLMGYDIVRDRQCWVCAVLHVLSSITGAAFEACHQLHLQHQYPPHLLSRPLCCRKQHAEQTMLPLRQRHPPALLALQGVTGGVCSMDSFLQQFFPSLCVPAAAAAAAAAAACRFTLHGVCALPVGPACRRD